MIFPVAQIPVRRPLGASSPECGAQRRACLGAQTFLPGVGTNWHDVKLGFQGRQITVYYDGVQVLTVTDVDTRSLPAGGITLDMWNDQVPYTLYADEVIVRPLVADDSYILNED